MALRESLEKHMRSIWLASGALIGALVVWFAMQPSVPEPQPVIRLALSAPGAQEVTDVAIAPDGTGAAYVAYAAGRRQLFYRALHQSSPVALPDTDGARQPFFSPDGRSIAFFAEDKLLCFSLDDGSLTVIAAAPSDSAGGAWTHNGTIIFAPLRGRGLMEVTVDGGALQPVTQLDIAGGEIEHGWPSVLPQGKGIVFAITKRNRDTRMAVWSPDNENSQILLPVNGRARYLSSGHLVYMLGEEMFGVDFNLDTLEITSTPTIVFKGVAASVTGFSGLGQAHFDLSSNGSLGYIPSTAPQNELAWIDRSGLALPSTTVPVTNRHRTPRLSHDGAYAAVVIRSGLLGHELWLEDLNNSERVRLVMEGSDNRSPAWTADGQLSFASNRLGPQNIFVTRLTSNETRHLIKTPSAQNPGAWTVDGRLAYYEVGRLDRNVLVRTNDGTIIPIAVTDANERSPTWSVDGAWLAYVSDENGFDQVYVQPYPPDGNRIIVSPSGGTEPVWSRDGRELFYRRDTEMIATEFTAVDGVLVIGEPNRLFEYPFDVDPGDNLPNYDVAHDGSFLMLRRAEPRHEIQIVVGWKPVLH